MKHFCNDDAGIKMNSNEHGAIKGNVEHLTTNNLTYYTHKTEEYAQRYDAMNRATLCKNISGLGHFRGQPSWIQIWIGAAH